MIALICSYFENPWSEEALWEFKIGSRFVEVRCLYPVEDTSASGGLNTFWIYYNGVRVCSGQDVSGVLDSSVAVDTSILEQYLSNDMDPNNL